MQQGASCASYFFARIYLRHRGNFWGFSQSRSVEDLSKHTKKGMMRTSCTVCAHSLEFGVVMLGLSSQTISKFKLESSLMWRILLLSVSIEGGGDTKEGSMTKIWWRTTQIYIHTRWILLGAFLPLQAEIVSPSCWRGLYVSLHDLPATRR